MPFRGSDKQEETVASLFSLYHQTSEFFFLRPLVAKASQRTLTQMIVGVKSKHFFYSNKFTKTTTIPLLRTTAAATAILTNHAQNKAK